MSFVGLDDLKNAKVGEYCFRYLIAIEYEIYFFIVFFECVDSNIFLNGTQLLLSIFS